MMHEMQSAGPTEPFWNGVAASFACKLMAQDMQRSADQEPHGWAYTSSPHASSQPGTVGHYLSAQTAQRW